MDPPAPVDRQPRLPPGQADMAGTSTQNSEAANQAANNNSSNVTSKVPRVAKTFRAYLPSACHRTYSCVHCRAHLANHDELISKSFQGSQGRAYLFNSVVNIGCGPAEERVLLTGLFHFFSCQKTRHYVKQHINISPKWQTIVKHYFVTLTKYSLHEKA